MNSLDGSRKKKLRTVDGKTTLLGWGQSNPAGSNILQCNGVCFSHWLGSVHHLFPSLICLASCTCSRRARRLDNIAFAIGLLYPYLHTRFLGLLPRNLIAALPGNAFYSCLCIEMGGWDVCMFSAFIYLQAWLDSAHKWIGGAKTRIGFDGIEEAYNELTSK